MLNKTIDQTSERPDRTASRSSGDFRSAPELKSFTHYFVLAKPLNKYELILGEIRGKQAIHLDLSRDRSEQRPERFAVGDKLDARVTQLDTKARKIGLSIKALEIARKSCRCAVWLF